CSRGSFRARGRGRCRRAPCARRSACTARAARVPAPPSAREDSLRRRAPEDLIAAMLVRSVLSLLAAQAASAGAPAAPPAETRIELRESAAIAEWFHVRAIAEHDAPDPVAELQPAVEAARALGRALGGNALAWGPLEGGFLPGCETAADIAAAVEQAPETFELR